MAGQRVLIVSNTQGMLATSMKTQLQRQNFEADICPFQIRDLSQLKETMEAVLLFCDESMTENQQALVYLRDKCLEEDLPVFMVGDQGETARIAATIPESLIMKVFMRPVNVGEAAQEIAEHINNHGKNTKKTILVVDDSGAMLRSVKGWLENKYRVILANSGAMAIKYLALNRPDLILLDYEMPVVDGSQVLGMIRSEHDFEDVPVIFLTSKNDKESVASVLKLKPEGYLLKTMKPEEIVKSIDDFFVKQKMKQI